MVRIPERLEGLLPNALMGRGVHQHHAKEHDMSGNSASFCIVNLHGFNRPDMIFFDVVKATFVRTVASLSYRLAYFT
jgi:hypothetical protein